MALVSYVSVPVITANGDVSNYIRIPLDKFDFRQRATMDSLSPDVRAGIERLKVNESVYKK
jgi:hypothetical protein